MFKAFWELTWGRFGGSTPYFYRHNFFLNGINLPNFARHVAYFFLYNLSQQNDHFMLVNLYMYVYIYIVVGMPAMH